MIYLRYPPFLSAHPLVGRMAVRCSLLFLSAAVLFWGCDASGVTPEPGPGPTPEPPPEAIDGSLVFLTEADGVISLTTVDVATRERVTTPMEPFPGLDHVSRLRVSPDMGRVLYNSVPGPHQEYTWLAPPDGTNPQLQPDMSGGCCGDFELKGFEWGPESRQVLYPYFRRSTSMSFTADNLRERTVASNRARTPHARGGVVAPVPGMELGPRCGPHPNRREQRKHLYPMDRSKLTCTSWTSARVLSSDG